MRQLTFIIVVIFVAELAVMLGQPSYPLQGTVLNAETHAGIENLQIKLTPPKTSNSAIQVTTTDRNGRFRFQNVQPGRYLIEVSQGVNLIYRNVVDTQNQPELTITLRPR